MRTEVILQHGWAFDSRAWWQWLAPMHSAGADVLLGERGYFGGTQFSPKFSSNAEMRIIVAHSLGLHMLDDVCLRNADVILSIGSFLQFHPEQPLDRKRSQRVMRMMLDKFRVAPYEVLQQFLANTYYPASETMPVSYPHSHLDVDRLFEDLRFLDRTVLDPELLRGKQLIIAHGAHDKIVPVTAAAAMIEALPESVFYLFTEAGHALSLTHAPECLHLLTNLMAPSGLSPAATKS
jgi:pimeloyl-ACP methyl ester carboxylesterase